MRAILYALLLEIFQYISIADCSLRSIYTNVEGILY